MSFGKMTEFIDIVEKETVKDSEGFKTEKDKITATVRAYREGRHGSEKWANRASFSDATHLFRFRCIPGVKITTAMTIVCNDGRFDIASVENVKGKGMYVEVLAKEIIPSR